MRDGFRDIVSGWTLISGMADITDRIEAAAEWTKPMVLWSLMNWPRSS